MHRLRVGSRGSKLALWQTRHVIQQLGVECELVIIHTTADQRQDVPLAAIGDKSLFLKEIEEALWSESIDFAVHSLKDVPSRLDPRFALGAILLREDARDVVLNGGLGSVPPSGRVGSGSLRREAQLHAPRPDLNFQPIRGNVDTRLRKLADGQFDAIVLAAAGLRRLGIPIPPEAFLDLSECLPAPGQAAMCVESLAQNREILDLLRPLDHAHTRAAVEAERAFAAALEAGCRVPLGAYAQCSDGALVLDTVVASSDGRQMIRTSGQGSDPAELGQRIARDALSRGAGALLHSQS